MIHVRRNFRALPFLLLFYLRTFSLSEIDNMDDDDDDYDRPEDKFVKLYGNDVNKSGTWQEVRNVATNQVRLRSMALRAIKMVLNPAFETFEIREARHVVKTLKFVEIQSENIQLDVLEFELFYNDEERLVYITKGFRSECALFLKKLNESETVELFRMDKHRCGILNLYL